MRVKALQTILVLILALLVLTYLQGHPYFFGAAIVLAFIGAFMPALAEKIHWLWMKLGEGLGFVTSKIILTIIFFVVLVPLSWLAGIFRKPVVKMKREGDTFYKSRNFTYTQKSMQDVW
jgi:hypothetical protein